MIKVGILGYGNLGKGVQNAITISQDMSLEVIFSKRNITIDGIKVEPLTKLADYKGKLDVLVCCGGSATDLPMQTPMAASLFNFVDSFDNHSFIPQHFRAVDEAAKKAGTVGVISAGWDPGLFSLNRLYGESVLQNGKTYTFWGKGVSQGHTQALKGIEGVENAVQYTIPIENALNQVREGNEPEFSAREKHKRVCYIVASKNANREKITQTIVNMPDYFAPYDTEVNFISQEEFELNHKNMPHGGFVIRSGATPKGNHTIEFSLKLSENPEFTGSVLAAYARAVYRLSQQKAVGAYTVLDVAPALLSPKSPMELYKELL